MVYNSIFPSFQNRPYSLYALSSQSVCIVLTVCMHCSHYLYALCPLSSNIVPESFVHDT